MIALLNKLNGVVLPGNDDNTGDGGYYQRVKKILDFSKKLKKLKKTKFPVLGIARGAEKILSYITKKVCFTKILFHPPSLILQRD